jgi:hypothetical protein
MPTGIAVAQVVVEWDERLIESDLEVADTAMALCSHIGYVFSHGGLAERIEETHSDRVGYIHMQLRQVEHARKVPIYFSSTPPLALSLRLD